MYISSYGLYTYIYIYIYIYIYTHTNQISKIDNLFIKNLVTTQSFILLVRSMRLWVAIKCFKQVIYLCGLICI